MSKQRVMFSPVTRLSGLLSVDAVLEKGKIIDAKSQQYHVQGL